MNIITAGTRKITIPNFGPVVPARPMGGAAAFTGAYDAVPNIVGAYGMRRLLSSYTGNLLRIRRSSDNAEQNFGYDANGDLDTAAIATFVGAGSGFAVTWYDQSGNGFNATQATAANQPLYVASGQNARPVLRYDGSDDRLLTGDVFAIANALSFLIALKSNSNQKNILHLHSPSELYIGHGAGTAHKFEAFTNNRTPAGWHSSTTSITGVWKIGGVVMGATTLDGYLNGASEFSATQSGSISGTLQLMIGGRADIGGAFMAGDFAELVFADAAWITADRQATESAANDYWSIF